MAEDLAPLDYVDDITPGTVKKFIAALRFLFGNSNPVLEPRISRTFRDLLDEITVENASRVLPTLMNAVVDDSRWASEPPHTRPTVSDVLSRTTDYAKENVQAGGHGKRKILWNAFFSSFDPKFFKDGMATHLWRLAKELEYPELRFLRDYREWERNPKGRDTHAPKDDFLIRELMRLGLLVEHRTGRSDHRTTSIVDRLMEFVWDESMWNADGTPKTE